MSAWHTKEEGGNKKKESMLARQTVEGCGHASGFEGKGPIVLPATMLCTAFEEPECAFSSAEVD